MISLRPLFLSIEDVAAITGLSKSTVEELVRNGDFPKQRAASKRSARWLYREVEAWCESRPIADFLPPPNSSLGGKNSGANKSLQS